MTVTRVRRVVNPHRKSKARRNPRRKLSAKQIRFFGTPAQKAALRRKRRAKATANPHRKRTVARHTVKRRRSTVKRTRRAAVNPRRKSRAKRNPGVITLGFINPQRTKKRRASMARKRRSTAKRVNPRRRRRNSTRIVVVAPRRRRHNPRRSTHHRVHHRVHHRSRNTRRRNPELFGQKIAGVDLGKVVIGGLLGVTGVKVITPMLPSSITGSPVMASLSSVGVAFGLGFAAKRAFTGSLKVVGEAVLFGGLMQAGSIMLNAFLPSIGSTIGLSGYGMGDLVPGRFTVPQNPILLGSSMPTVMTSPTQATPAVRSGTSGIGRSFGSAF